MSSDNQIFSSKELLIETFEIAEINFLQSFKDIRPEIVSKQFKEDVNHIAWILGHCISHMDSYPFPEQAYTCGEKLYHSEN